MSKPGLQSLLNVESPTVFLKECWPNQFFLAEGPSERLHGLTSHSFEDLLKMECEQTLVYRLVEGRTLRMRLTKGQETPLYKSGFTIHFLNLKSPAFEDWLRALEVELCLAPGSTRISAYASRQGERLGTHFDAIDNFVCQARGVKRWRLASNPNVQHPTFGYVMGENLSPENRIHAPDGFPSQMPEPCRTVELQPGSVMYVPRGMWHATETVETESLHFNIRIGLGLLSWRDLVECALRNAGGSFSERLRAPVMRLFDGEEIAGGIQEELKQTIRGFADAVCGTDKPLQRESLREFIARSRSQL